MPKTPSRDKRLPVSEQEAKYLEKRDDFQRDVFDKAFWFVAAAAVGGGAAGIAWVLYAAIGSVAILSAVGLLTVQNRYGRLADAAREEALHTGGKDEARLPVEPAASPGMSPARPDDAALVGHPADETRRPPATAAQA